MANTNAPFGARPYEGLGSGANFQIQKIKAGIDDANSTKIYKGDLVKKLNTGYLAQWTATTAVSQLAGIFWGCQYLSTAIGRRVYSPYWPGADTAVDADIFLIPVTGAAPLQVVMQCDSTGVALADRGANFDIAVGSGSTTTSLSGSYVDVSTLNTTATLPLRLVHLWSDIAVGPGTQSGAYNWGVFQFNATGAGATGI